MLIAGVCLILAGCGSAPSPSASSPASSAATTSAPASTNVGGEKAVVGIWNSTLATTVEFDPDHQVGESSMIMGMLYEGKWSLEGNKGTITPIKVHGADVAAQRKMLEERWKTTFESSTNKEASLADLSPFTLTLSDDGKSMVGMRGTTEKRLMRNEEQSKTAEEKRAWDAAHPSKKAP